MTKALLGSNIANFWANRGRRVVERCGVYWRQAEGYFFQSLPYRLTIDPPFEEIDEFLRAERALGVRYPSKNRPSVQGGVYTFEGDSYDIKTVHPKVRARVRRGLENFEYGPVEPAMLLEQALSLNRDTMARQGRYDRDFGEPARWRQLVKAIETSPGVAIYGAYAKDRLSAYMVTCLDDGWLQILHQMSNRAELPLHANQGLTFSITEKACRSPDIEAVCYGLLSIHQEAGLDEYKQRLGYRLRPHNDVIRLHPVVAPLLCGQPTKSVIHLARTLRPKDERLERLEKTMIAAAASRFAAVDRVSTT